MSYQDILRGLLPPVSYARNAPRVRAQAEIDGAALDAVAESAQRLPMPSTRAAPAKCWPIGSAY